MAQNEIYREIWLTENRRVEPIAVSENSKIPIKFKVMDTTISGSTARAYAYNGRTGAYTANVTNPTVASNVVTLIPDSGLFLAGSDRLQIQFPVSGGNYITREFDVVCAPDYANGGTTPKAEDVKGLTERAEAAAKTASDVLASIPEDYSQLSESITEIKEDLSELFTFDYVTEFDKCIYPLNTGNGLLSTNPYGNDLAVSIATKHGYLYNVVAGICDVCRYGTSSTKPTTLYQRLDGATDASAEKRFQISAIEDGYVYIQLLTPNSGKSIDEAIATLRVVEKMDNLTNLIEQVNNTKKLTNPRNFVQAILNPLTSQYRVYAKDGKWIITNGNDRITLYKNDGSIVKNTFINTQNGNVKKRIYSDGSWDYAEVYTTQPIGVGIVNTGTLVIGDSYVQSTMMVASITKYLKSGVWSLGYAGQNAKAMVGFITGVGSETSNYDPDYINAWRDGNFDRAMIWCGANKLTTTESIAENDVDSNIPKVKSGSIASILSGGSATVDDVSVTTIHDYYSHYGLTTIGQLAFLVEYLQALQAEKPIYLMGYFLWSDYNTRNDADFIINVCSKLENIYGVKFINSFRDVGLNKRNAQIYLTDGVHPSNDACDLYWSKVTERNTIV